jgi:hypothetical protein
MLKRSLDKKKDLEKPLPLFKKIFYAFPDHNLGYTAAYNLACMYSVKGDKVRGLDWLEISIKHGFRKFDHLKKDPDLEKLKDDSRYKEILRRFASD